ncbi:MAG: ThuA domain-containing protein [Planctomycetaceae bacterium]|nr:ThuA domain-containing protein [Planctomycetaceae bacterium]MCB9952582.1 ThuA domain-containing protein [Planctomycetaceae bacterium]
MKFVISPVFALVCFLSVTLIEAAEPVHVLVWDERQPRQSEAYDNFLGNEIAAQLKALEAGLEVRSVSLDDPQQGLSVDNLEWADVIIWWGHVRQNEVLDDNANRILDRVLAGEVDLIALHSAHWSKPFMKAMNWRSIEDGKRHFEQFTDGAKFSIETVDPPRPYTVPTHGSLLTPAYFSYKKSQTDYQGMIHLPWCCFPDYRPDGAPSQVAVKLPEHPIAKGLPKGFQVQQTEMYNEPFHVPVPDEVIFEETWELGERFRAGMIWNIGEGKVFYFRPGHETFPVYKQAEVIRVLANACQWLGTN